jgi:TonB family protein
VFNNYKLIAFLVMTSACLPELSTFSAASGQGDQSISVKLSAAEPIALRFENIEKAPLSIVHVKARVISRDKKNNQNVPGDASDDYLVSPIVTVTNNSDRRVTALLLEFRTGGAEPDYLYRELDSQLEPEASITIGERVERFLALPTEPSSWVVKVAGAVFDGGTYWGFAVRPPPVRLPVWVSEEKLTSAASAAKERKIRFKNVRGVPLTVTQASARAIRESDVAADDYRGSRWLHSLYLVFPSVKFLNNTDRRIIMLQLRVRTKEGELVIRQQGVNIEPQQSYTLTVSPAERLHYLETRDLKSVEVKLEGVMFEDNEHWGRLAPTIYPALLGFNDMSAYPAPLNSPRPMYTEEARQNKVQGEVRLHILVGSDGRVKNVRITRGLSHGLNEEAVRCAYEIRFKPAIKWGIPVSYWIPIEVSFSLR